MSVTDEIKARIDIVQYISKFVQLKKAGRNYVARCPFHDERTPSFVVFPDSQGWHCFGACGEGGDVFNFVMKREGLDFVSALRLLANEVGIELQERSPAQRTLEERHDKLRGLLEETGRFFHETLVQAPFAGDARAYVRQRGLSEASIVNFGLGYAPNDWQAALDHLRMLGYTTDDLIDAGLAVRNEAGRVYDRFRNRLMIPICDERGRVIGFGARALDPADNPKYLNSPQTELFDKGSTLFGLHMARRAIREHETAVIVEGYMDVIQAHQAGFTNVVAQMGTALTKPQLKQLSKYGRRLILALDADTAGNRATMRGLDVVREASEEAQLFFDPAAIMRQASRLDVEILVTTLPEGQDPDDLIRQDPDAWRAALRAAQPVADYVIAIGTASLAPEATLGERERVARELLPILMATENDLQRHANIQQLAYKLRLGSGRTLVEWAQRHNYAPRVTPQTTRQADEKTAPGPEQAADAARPVAQPEAAIERYCLAMLLHYPEFLSAANRRLRELAASARMGRTGLEPLSIEDFTRSDYRAVFDTLRRALSQDEQEVLEYLEQHLPFELRELVEQLLVQPLTHFEQRLSRPLRAELDDVLRAQRQAVPSAALTDVEVLQRAFERRILELRKLRLKRESTELQILQQEADPETDQEYGRRLAANVLAVILIDEATKLPQAR